MEPLTLKQREPAKDSIECWDDDDDLQSIDDLQFRNLSSTTVGTAVSAHTSHHHDSISLRLGGRSDVDADEDWQVLLPTDDELSTRNAIASAKNAGIPIPENVPPSALRGGAIIRLGGRRLKKVQGDDWGEDLELPKPEDGGLKLKMSDGKEFPDALRQVSLGSSKTPSPAKPFTNMTFMERLRSASKATSAMSTLEKFCDDDGDVLGDVPTIKIAKNRRQQQDIVNYFGSPIRAKRPKETENFEDDLEFPAGREPLKLLARKEIPRTPANQSQDDFDTEWAEGSQGSFGTSLGGTRRTGRSNRSSSISALSPSVFSPSLSSCLTAESEDEGLDGLVLPDGPLQFEAALQKRLQNASPDPTDGKKAENRVAAKEDFFADIEIGDGDVFGSAKLTLNRNIKHKATRHPSPKRTATTLTFTNKPSALTTRIPKPAERPRSMLEPVSESSVLMPNYHRSQSRLGGHSSQSSTSSVPTPLAPSFPPSGPTTPSRRGLAGRASRDAIRPEATTTSAQLLKAKRSMPAMRTHTSPAKPPPAYQRPLSRTEKNPKSVLPRPKTPSDRSRIDSSLGAARKPPIPFLPAGNVHAQSHHVTTKTSRNFRPSSSNSNENTPLNRPISRLSNPQHRPPTPNRKDIAPESLAREAAAKRTLTKPTRRRAFGDGKELDVFDDLPTSATVEAKFLKQPVKTTSKSSNLRAKLNSSQNPSLTSLPRSETPLTPLSPRKYDSNVPSFARDTTASRLAREQRAGSVHPPPQRNPHNTPLAPVSVNWKTIVTTKPTPSPRHALKRSTKTIQKPQLIKPLGSGASEPKNIKNMHWNPILFRWEGNEHALAPFDAPLPIAPGSPRHGGLHVNTKPALIANFGTVKGVQVVGGMVFDPQRMCWLKMARKGGRGRSDSATMSPATDDDEEDPFAGLDDLEDEKRSIFGDGSKDFSKLEDDEWLVGEEFDIGPEFKKRQRAEEEKWRKKMEIWTGKGVVKLKENEGRWALREWMEKW